MAVETKVEGQNPDLQGKCICIRCGKRLSQNNFYTHRDGSKFTYCKPCITAHVDNFDPSTFTWILKLADVPYIPSEWVTLRDRAFQKDPYKMNGMSVIGKYLGKMKLNQFNKYHYADSESIQQKLQKEQEKRQQLEKNEREKYQAELKVKLSEGKISQAEYKTLMSVQTQNKQLPRGGDVINGIHPGNMQNAFQQGQFLSEDELNDPGEELEKQDKIYLAMKWGRLYKPSQWIVLEQLYNEFMSSFDIQGAARIDTLKMICKTSLKMNQAIDCGDIDAYQKLSRVYDSLMKSAKFTEAQNKDKQGHEIDSVSAIVDFVEAHEGAIPKYDLKQPLDKVDQIIFDLKAYNRNLIYEDKSLAREIQKYLQSRKIAEEMRRDRKEAKAKGLDYVQIKDEQLLDHKRNLQQMKQHDKKVVND